MQTTVLSLKNIHKSFGTKKVHQGINLDLQEGEIIGLLGGSGTGKSVLIRSVIGLEKPDQGSILFENKDIHSTFNRVHNLEKSFSRRLVDSAQNIPCSLSLIMYWRNSFAEKFTTRHRSGL
jgi:ABC-type transporter Mla maintaining outer membrane lipid asymmetry ATPase subunit MlaF